MLEEKLMNELSRRGFLKTAAGLAGLVLTAPSRDILAATNPYSITQATNPNQYRFWRDGKHFMSLIYEGGIFDFRPHPLVDSPDAWGSSWYFQPFLPGAVLSVAKAKKIEESSPMLASSNPNHFENFLSIAQLANTQITSITADASGINVSANGKVADTPGTYGNWNSTMRFSFDPAEQKISGIGTYSITLDGLLSGRGDLNLFKIASNLLENVPLIGNGYGNTGDMKRVDIVYKDGRRVIWNPIQTPDFFPQDITDSLSMDVVGDYNHVDLKRMGYSFGINPAKKPSLKVMIISNNSGVPMIFGGFYDTTKKQDFTADNVGITPLILRSSPSRTYSFDIIFESIPRERTTGVRDSGLYE